MLVGNTMDSIRQKPRVILELVIGLDPAHPQIEIKHENMPQGWVTCVQILHGALGAALAKAFEEVLQQGQQLESQQRIVLANGMNDLRR